MIALRPHHEIDRRRATDDLLSLSLGHAARDRDGHAAPFVCGRLLEHADAAELGIDLVRRLLADVAGIEDDEIRVVGTGGFDEAFGCEHVRHTMGIVDVHLAAEGFDVEPARCTHAGRVDLRPRMPSTPCHASRILRRWRSASEHGLSGFGGKRKWPRMSLAMLYSGARTSASLMTCDHLPISELT